jgi:hypothetical protein
MPKPKPWPIAHAMPRIRPPSMVLRITTINEGPGEAAPSVNKIEAAIIAGQAMSMLGRKRAKEMMLPLSERLHGQSL